MSAPARLAARQRLWVAETFADTVQGEGPSIGAPAAFIRLSRCNLTCTWCDTPYTWDRSRFDLAAESRRASAEELASWALGRPEELVVISGGEPLLQQRALVPLARMLIEAGRRVEIETNATYPPAAELAASGACFNVSPKLAGSRVPSALRIRPSVLEAFAALPTPRRVFKFVVTGLAELDEVDRLVARHRLRPVWVMPEGTTPEKITHGLRELAEGAATRGYRLGARLHVLLWGDERGR
ncbi:7-carboxy-7-deazaguanine synthase QueE [Streptomyces sp. DSM 44917]|uniref:7-carboxy-7-deazaguanine synthase n=1 Tax=Streptomyces boetiae TaxID=3075541 RepID=A0ABU2L7U8_9ACTN|nr:7-carboxy-7-deazaguanine synthase QueE [Streptomyces sp. DSM 44917]MDT0307644.1 7-carboxy-7-deazaguanine synthase QueE [Streptomyces sp. DSM 44917]